MGEREGEEGERMVEHTYPRTNVCAPPIPPRFSHSTDGHWVLLLHSIRLRGREEGDGEDGGGGVTL